MCVVLGGDVTQSALARGRARFQRGEVCYTPNFGHGWRGFGSRRGVLRIACTTWLGAGAASLMSPRQGETSQSEEIGAEC